MTNLDLTHVNRILLPRSLRLSGRFGPTDGHPLEIIVGI